MRKYSLFLITLIFLRVSNGFIFSIIMAIYNTGRYLDESLESLTKQTIGFKNIQMILINDGSTDNSEKLCLKYQKKYEQNVIYIKNVHQGVSKTRNIGLKYASGKFINFLDADDKWGLQSFKYVFIFFKMNRNVDIISGRLKFFEALNSYHPLDYKFSKTRIVNLTENYDCIQLSGPSSFFRKFLIINKKFNENVFSGEDTIIINKILLKKPIIAFLKEAIYFYRRRSDYSSAVQNQNKVVEYYFSQLQLVDQYLINKSKKLYNEVLPFIQFYIGYNVLFRIISPAYKFLNNKDLNSYCIAIENQLKQIDDKYILEQKFASYKTKLFALSLKYKRDVRYDIIQKNNLFIYSGKILINLSKRNKIIIWNNLNFEGNALQLEGKDNFWFPKNIYYYYCRFANNTFFPSYKYYSGFDFYTMYGLSDKGRMINFNIPIGENNGQSLNFFISYKGKEIEIFPSLGKFTHISKIKNGYYSNGKYN